MNSLADTSITQSAFTQASIHSDLSSLDSIRKQGLTDEKGAIAKAAKEFEAFFMNMLFKSMRQASEVISEDSPFNSQQEKMFTSMLDEQMSVELSQQGNFGIAELMISQLTNSPIEPVKKTIKYVPPVDQVALKVNSSTSNPLANNMSNEHGASKLSEAAAVRKVDKATQSVSISSSNASEKVALEPEAITNSLVDSSALETRKVKVEKKALFDNAKDFVASLLPVATKAAKQLAVDPKLLLAQAALETGWGKYVMHDEAGKPGFNLFGIKANNAWQGESIVADTLEVENQAFKKVSAAFRKYHSLQESFTDYVNFIKGNSRYQGAVKASSDEASYANELQSSGYATDPNYAEKILKIYQMLKTSDLDSSEQ
ncbi:flagellar assembly peptidoglycan hydrolase FlgJ [Aliikangiella sp. IMCC44632]